MTEQEFYKQVGEELVKKLKARLQPGIYPFLGVQSFEITYYNAAYNPTNTVLTIRDIILRKATPTMDFPDFSTAAMRDLLDEFSLKVHGVYYNPYLLNLELDFSGYLERVRPQRQNQL